MKKTIYSCSLGAVLLVSSGAAEIFFDTSAKTGTELWDNQNIKTTDNGDVIYGNNLLQSQEMYSVDALSRYRLTGKFKSATDKTGKFFFGLVPFDENKIPIELYEVNAVYETDTTLVTDCKAADKVLKVKNAVNWKVDPFVFVAFDAKPDFSDLPNRTLSGQGIAKIEKTDDGWLVTLKNPCGQNFPAGTLIRLHAKGSKYLYCGAFSRNADPDWVPVGNFISEVSQKGESRTQFWAGTKYVKVVILANYLQKEDVGLLFKEIKFEKLDGVR